MRTVKKLIYRLFVSFQWMTSVGVSSTPELEAGSEIDIKGITPPPPPYLSRRSFTAQHNPIQNLRIVGSSLLFSADPDPGCGMSKKSGSTMNNPDHISESLETIFWVKKYLNSLMRIRDERNSDPVSWMEKLGSGIRHKHPGSRHKHPESATLPFCI